MPDGRVMPVLPRSEPVVGALRRIRLVRLGDVGRRVVVGCLRPEREGVLEGYVLPRVAEDREYVDPRRVGLAR